jgi:cell division protein FtsZ
MPFEPVTLRPAAHPSLPSPIKVIGVGGGGSNAVNTMFERGIAGVDFIVCNTDAQALDASPVPSKIQLGATLTGGQGAGSQPEVGRNAAIESLDEVIGLLGTGTSMVFVTAGMGGGTGTGAAPVIAKAARDLDILTVGIVTIPFQFEGKRRTQQAAEGLEAMRKSVDTLLIIRNDKLRELYGNLTIRKAFANADEVLCTAAKGIAEVITLTGEINVDMNDVNTVMRNSGRAIMGSGVAVGEGRARLAVSEALESPLLNDCDITGASFVLLNITFGHDEVLMDEIMEITDIIQQAAGQSAEVIWGYGIDPSLGDALCVTVIATGFDGADLGPWDGPAPATERRHLLNETAVPVAATPRAVAAAPAPAPVAATTWKPVLTAPEEPFLITREEPVEDAVEETEATPELSHWNLTSVSLEDYVLPAPTAAEERMNTVVFHLEEEPTAEEIVETEMTLRVEELPTHAWAEVEEVVQQQVVEPLTLLSSHTPQSQPQPQPQSQSQSQPDPQTPPALAWKPWEGPRPAAAPAARPEASTPPPPPIARTEAPVEKDDFLSRQFARAQRLQMYTRRFKSPGGIADLENEPAYKRRNVVLDDVAPSTATSVSRFALSEEVDEHGDRRVELRSDNPFLHDNVD